MHPFIKTILYGLGVFVIFIILAVVLKLLTHRVDENAYFGIITKNDLLMGIVVALFVSLSHERKKKLK